MGIDWITVSAQIVNFLILVWLLKRFLYRPVLRAMDRREQRITDRLTEAQEREARAEESAERYRRQSEDLDRSRGEILDEAEREAEQQRKQMLEEARQEVAETRTRWQRQVQQEKEEFLANLRRQTVTAVQAVARKTLDDLADADLEDAVAHKFTQQLKSLDAETRRALSDSDEPVRITSAFELAAATRATLTRTVHECIEADIDVEYRTSADLICGLELLRGGRRLGWNMKDYLDDLTARTEEAFQPLPGESGEESGDSRAAAGEDG